jgi:5'-nucleotidase
MNERSKLAVLLTAFTALASASAAACSGDDSATPAADGGVTADASHPSDATTNDATTSDASTTDATSDTSSEAATPDGGTVSVQILAFNDFHGNLRAPSPSNAVVVAKPGDPAISDAGAPVPTDAGVVDGGPLNTQISAGGAVYFAAHVKRLRAANPNTLLVSSGDMTGASPLISSVYDDEPTIRVMNTIGVDLNGVGNHEFDHGPSELLRLQYGGCNAADHTDAGGSCSADPTFSGATFTYLSANVDVSTNKTLFPPYEIKTIGGAKIAFIGMTLQGTPAIVSAAGTAGLSFMDEIATVNALVPELKSQKVDSIVVLLHQGGFQAGTYDECVNLTGGTVSTGQHDIVAIANGLDPAIDVIASAHTHQPYSCSVGGKLLTSAASYGRLITKIDLTVDTVQHKVTAKTAHNVVVTRDITPDPDVKTLVDRYATLVAPIADRQVGQISADITKFAGANGEAPLGDVAADAFLAAGQSAGAVVAFTNIGGLRDSLLYAQYYSEGDGVVTFEKAQAVMPFRNKLEILQCTGAQIIAATQQNVFVMASGGTKVLQVSNGFTYSWASSAADAGVGAADPTSFTLNGAAVNPTSNYLVATTDFLAGGGDGYTALRGCTLQSVVGVDLNAFTAYLGAHEPLAAPAATRITKTN